MSATVFAELRQDQRDDLERSFEMENRAFAGAFQDTVDRHAGGLQATSALFAASEEVELDEFTAFVDRLALAERHPGLRGLAFVERVPGEDLDDYLDRRRSEGDGDFDVTPSGNRSVYWVLSYQNRSRAFPDAALLPLGLDLRTTTDVRAVLEDARDSGRPAATSTGVDGLEAGTVLVAHPVYANGTDPGSPESRRQAIEGWVVGYAEPDALLEAAAGPPDGAGVQLFEGAPEEAEPIAERGGDPPLDRAREAGFVGSEDVDVFDREWTLQFVALSGSAYLDPAPTPWLVLGGAVVVALLFFGLVWTVSRSEADALRRVEAATRDLREAQRVAQVGSWEWHVPSDTVSWSDEQYRLFGREPGDPPDPSFDTFLESVHPDDRDRVDDLVTEALEEGEFPTFECRAQDPDGTVRWLEARGTVEVEDGRVVRLRGTTLDITDRVLPLRRVESLVETSPDAIVQANEDGEIVGWNEGAEAIFGWDAEEILGEPLTAIMPEEYRDAHQEGFRRYLETGETSVMGQTVELEGLRADGETFPIELSLDTYTVGEARFFSGIVRDVTERKELEEELRQAKQEAEAADRAKSRFLANMSHEIRTPMNAIIGLAEILQDTDLSEEQRDHLRTLQSSSEHLLTLIDDILDFSKIEAGELALAHRPFDLRETVEEAFSMVSSRAGEKDLDLGYRYGDDVPEAIHGDPGRVRQVLVNLLSNGVKFTDEGEVILRVDRLEDGPGDGDEVAIRFEVEDTGKGIEEDEVEDLFDPFTQAVESADRPHEGTGLGLAISTHLVEMMGGYLEAEGEPGVGSTFRFVIPAEPAERPERRPWEARPETLEGARLLVVDDNETSRTIVRDLAKRWGLEVETSGSPEEALDRLRGGGTFDVAVLDYSMPGQTGVELARELRDDPDVADLPLVFLTSMPEAQREVRLAGVEAADVLVKPVKPSDLFDALRIALGEPETLATDASGGFDPELGDRLDLDVLVVEDNPVNLQVVEQMLSRFGIDSDSAKEGQEALARLDERDYDLVFMDVQMPGMDGLEATRRIREDLPDDRQPRIVALTAHAGAQDRQRTLEAGMDDYLAKPVDREALAEALERSASRSPPEEERGEESGDEAGEGEDAAGDEESGDEDAARGDDGDGS